MSTKLTIHKENSKDVENLRLQSQKLVLDLVKQSHSVYRKEINHWQQARMMRQSTHHPKTYLLQRVYDDALIDTHLTAVIENRILRIQNKRFVITNDKGITHPEKSQFITTRWFSDVIRHVMESVFYGYSLLHFIKENGQITGVNSIARGHVIPENNVVLKDISDTRGLDITKFPHDLALVQLYKGNGLLEKAVPMTVLKRHSWASWDEFEQLFGIPIRIAKVATSNDTVKNEVAGWLKDMGTASYGVFPAFAEIDIKEANNRDAFNVFMKKIETVDDQVSILINGQTMTVKDGSSHSQANVHQKTQDEITEADLKNVLYWLNDVLLPIMRQSGYNISQNEHIGVERITDPKVKIETDVKLLQNGYRFTKEYVERIYGVELETIPNPNNSATEKK